MKGVTAGVVRGARPPDISIHTPVKGVTDVAGARVDEEDEISIHTPVKGVTVCRILLSDHERI